MEAIIFVGIQASGKSTFYVNNFFRTHMRISMDLLNTRNKENQFIEKCIELHQSVVIDNTNPTKSEREKYINIFKSRKYRIIGYFFKTNLEDSLRRNSTRKTIDIIPEIGIKGTFKRMENPNIDEGFDELYEVVIKNHKFVKTKI